MIRTILADTLRLAADALDTHPAPERWEAELDALRQQIGDIDAAVADLDSGVMRGEKAAGDEIDRLKADVAWLRTELIDATRDADTMTARLDAARDGLKTAQSCLDRVGEARVVDALLAVERGLARSAPDVVREAVAEAARAADLATPAELDAVRKELCATRSSLTHVLDCVSEARMQLDRDEVSKALDALDAVENGLAKAPSDLATAPEPIDNAAELCAAGWSYKPHLGWTLGAYGLGYLSTEDAYRAMMEDREREKAQAATPRDTLTDPRPGDLFVDKDGEAWFCVGARTYILRTYEVQSTLNGYGIRPATPEEIAKFRKDHNL